MYWEALNRVKLAPNQYRCPSCKVVFKLREMQVDHIDPVINPETGWVDMPTFAARLNCTSERLQPLCQDNCHLKKSVKENKVRRVVKRLNEVSK